MRVLLIEDDSATAQSIELMLKSESFNVYTTDLGEEGVDLGKLYDYDIILLDPVPFWPLAPGWYALGWIVLIAIVWAAWSLVRQRRTNRYRSVALVELDQLEAAVHGPLRRVSALAELPALVKRVALAV